VTTPTYTPTNYDILEKSVVLVVEDDLNLLEGVRTVLELDDYEVLTAENGVQALEVLRRTPIRPDLIVSDIMMPMMNGIELLNAIREEPDWITIPFIFLTARSERPDVLLGKKLGADDYIIKPFDTEDLLVAVESRLKRHKAMDQVQRTLVDEMKRRILIILNHEFRTPLTFVVAYADMLSNAGSYNLSNEEILEFLKGVNTGAVRLRRLIESFIQLVELETGTAKRTYETRRAPIENIASLLKDAKTLVFTPEVKHTCTILIDENLPVFIGDVAYLKAALAQLLDNAIKFSPDDLNITMGARAENGYMLLWVSDNGRGINAEEQEKIWDVFYQIDRNTHEDQGAGSGLAIVRGIAELHGGTTTVQSEPGSGSTFTIAIPLKSYL
jgi:two-component system, sensor histidine kinase and response regulator